MDEALVGIIMGSESDKDTMKKGAAVAGNLFTSDRHRFKLAS